MLSNTDSGLSDTDTVLSDTDTVLSDTDTVLSDKSDKANAKTNSEMLSLNKALTTNSVREKPVTMAGLWHVKTGYTGKLLQ